MNIRKLGKITALACAISLTTAFTLSGCSSEPPAPPTDDNNQQTVEGPTTAGDDQSPFEENWAEAPDDFPAEIPIVSEKINHSATGTSPYGDQWEVFLYPDDRDAQMETVRSQMADAGFTEESWDGTPGAQEGVFLSPLYKITVAAIIGPYGDDTIAYTVLELK